MYARTLMVVSLMFVCRTSLADVLGHDTAQKISDSGTVAFLTAGALLPLFEDGSKGKTHTLRTLDAYVSALALEEAMKGVVKERRPDGSGLDSFPSGHAMESFAVATMESHYHPRQAPLWYGGAALISAARLDLNKHRLHDVLAGAFFGWGMARMELSSKNGLLFAPFIRPDSGAVGVSFWRSF